MELLVIKKQKYVKNAKKKVDRWCLSTSFIEIRLMLGVKLFVDK